MSTYAIFFSIPEVSSYTELFQHNLLVLWDKKNWTKVVISLLLRKIQKSVMALTYVKNLRKLDFKLFSTVFSFLTVCKCWSKYFYSGEKYAGASRLSCLQIYTEFHRAFWLKGRRCIITGSYIVLEKNERSEWGLFCLYHLLFNFSSHILTLSVNLVCSFLNLCKLPQSPFCAIFLVPITA